MKSNFKAVCAAVVIAFGLLMTSCPSMAQTAPSLGEAQDVTILGGSTVTSSGPTIVNGNLALSPGSSVTGFPPGTVIDGTINIDNALANQAHDNTVTAYDTLAGEAGATSLTGENLGGLTLAPGIYNFTTSAQLTGTLKLNNVGNANAIYIFQIGTTLTTATSSAVVLLGSTTDPNIFWQVGTSATIGSATVFDGNILADASITLDPGASLLDGKLLAINGAVTIADGSAINLNGVGGPTPSNPSSGIYWNGDTDNTWSGLNWSPNAAANTGVGSAEPLATEDNVVFSVNSNTFGPQRETTDLDASEMISSLTVNDPVPVTISSATNTLTINGSGATTGITINSGAGLTTINSSLALGGSSQTITVNNAAGLVINGDVSGAIGLTKAGIETLTLTGTNTYTDGTTINAGALVVGSAAALGGTPGQNNGNVTNGNALPADASTLATTASMGGSIETINVNGAYTQNASGNLLLQVVSSPTPVPSMNSGIAGINYDTLLSTKVASLAGALYLKFNATSDPSRGQRYVVLQSSPVTGDPVVGEFNNNLTDTTGLPSSLFAITTYNDNFGNPALDNSVIITLVEPFALFQGLTPNQISVATNVDNLLTGAYANNTNNMQNTPAATDFFNNIVTGLTLASYSNFLGHALDELSPQRFEILRNVAFDNFALDMQSLDAEFARERNGQGGIDTSGFVLNDSTLGSQLSQIKGRLLAWSPAPEPGLLSDSSQAVLGGVEMSDGKDMKEMTHQETLNRWNGFIDGGVDLGDLDSNIDEAHSSYTTGRVRAGVDYRVSTEIRVGALFGYGHTDVDLDNEGSKAHVDSFTPGIYATYADKQGFYANALFTGSLNDYSTDRNIIIPGVNRTATGSTSGTQFGGDLDGGYEFHKNNWTFGPSAGLTYVNLGIDSFNESGAGAADLNINNQSTDSLRSRLGGTVSYQGKIGSIVLTPYFNAFWQHEFLDNPTLITSQFQGLPGGTFSVQTTRGDSDNALLGAGVNADVTKNVTLFVDYQAEAGGSSFFGQSASAGVKVGF
jgi:autotransporter-associated beta strand protein